MSVVLITGNEPYRIKCELDRINREYDVSEYDLLEKEAFDDCFQMSLFSLKKAVVVRVNGLPDADGFQAYVKHPGCADLFLVADGLDKRSAIYRMCKSGQCGCRIQVLDKVPLEKFCLMCAGMINKRGCVVRESTIRMLYDYTGYGVNDDCNLFEISILIKQMCYQAGKGGEVTADMVEQFATPYEDAVIWHLSETLFSRDKRALLTLGEQLLNDGENPIAMLSALLRQFRLAFKAKIIGGTEKELSKALGIQAYHLRKAMSYDEKVLSEALGMVQRRVNDIKSGQEPTAVFRLALMEALFALQVETAVS